MMEVGWNETSPGRGTRFSRTGGERLLLVEEVDGRWEVLSYVGGSIQLEWVGGWEDSQREMMTKARVRDKRQSDRRAFDGYGTWPKTFNVTVTGLTAGQGARGGKKYRKERKRI